MTEAHLPDEIEPKAETAVWFQLLHHGPLTIQDLYERVDRPSRTIRHAVQKLEDRNLVKTYHQPEDPKQRVVKRRQ